MTFLGYRDKAQQAARYAAMHEELAAIDGEGAMHHRMVAHAYRELDLTLMHLARYEEWLETQR
jgi:hypothetical protein